MRHTKENCISHDLIIAGDCGLQCSNCLQCKCGNCNQRAYEKEKKRIEEEHETLNSQYSYPTHQVEALKKKYGVR